MSQATSHIEGLSGLDDYQDLMKWSFGLCHFYIVFSKLQNMPGSPEYSRGSICSFLRSLALNLLVAQSGGIIGAALLGKPVLGILSDSWMLFAATIIWALIYHVSRLASRLLKPSEKDRLRNKVVKENCPKVIGLIILIVARVGWEARRITVIVNNVKKASDLKFGLLALIFCGFITGTALKWAGPIYKLIVSPDSWEEALKKLKWDMFSTWSSTARPWVKRLVIIKRIFYLICFSVALVFSIHADYDILSIVWERVIMLCGWIALVLIWFLEEFAMRKDKAPEGNGGGGNGRGNGGGGDGGGGNAGGGNAQRKDSVGKKTE